LRSVADLWRKATGRVRRCPGEDRRRRLSERSGAAMPLPAIAPVASLQACLRGKSRQSHRLILHLWAARSRRPARHSRALHVFPFSSTRSHSHEGARAHVAEIDAADIVVAIDEVVAPGINPKALRNDPSSCRSGRYVAWGKNVVSRRLRERSIRREPWHPHLVSASPRQFDRCNYAPAFEQRPNLPGALSAEVPAGAPSHKADAL
jgi:hypothetical protein